MALPQLAQAARPRSATAEQTTARLAYVDNLRAVVIAMVVVHHAGQAYGPSGGDWPIANPTRAAILEPFFIVNAAFGLGLLFLIAGYLVPHAYDRKGVGRFLADRLIRLGLPLLFVSLVLFLPLGYAMDGQGQPFGTYLATELRQPEVGHMWFASYLILLSCGYALWRRLTYRNAPVLPQPSPAPSHYTILAYALALAAVTFLVRIRFPVDEWIDPLPFVRLDLAHVPQYVSMFILGAMAYQHGWLSQMPTRVAKPWLAIGLCAAALPYAATILGQFTPIAIDLGTDGGLSLAALVSSTIEAFIVVGLSVGLLTLFRERVNVRSALARDLAAASYAVYIIHIFPVVGLQLALEDVRLPPLAKFGVVALIAVPLCFALACGLRKLPGVRRLV